MEIEIDPSKWEAGKTVLAVDDNPMMRKILAGVFLSDGFKTCAEAENGKEGIKVAKSPARPLIIEAIIW